MILGTVLNKTLLEYHLKLFTDTFILFFRCVDFVMLIIIYSNVFGRKTQMATLMRNKIKAGILEETHVQHFFKILLVVAVEHSSAILELASIFLKSYEVAIADFGAALYEESFTNYSFYLRQNVVSKNKYIKCYFILLI